MTALFILGLCAGFTIGYIVHALLQNQQDNVIISDGNEDFIVEYPETDSPDWQEVEARR